MTDTTAPTVDTVPKKEHDRVLGELTKLKANIDELKATHGTTLQTLQGVEAERDSAASKIAGLQETVTETLLAPMVARLLHPSAASLLPKPTFDEATGRISEQWSTDATAWMTEHESLLKPVAAPATPAPASPDPRPSTPPSAGGNPVRNKEYWINLMTTDINSFRRRFPEYQADKSAGGW